MKNIKLIAIIGLAVIAIQFFLGEKLIRAASTNASLLVSNVNQNDEPINDAALIGRKYKVVENSTTETLVCSSPCVLDGVYITSGAATTYLIFADTTAVNGTGTVIIPGMYLPAAGVNSVPLSGFPPIATTIGLTVDANVASGSVLIAYHYK